MLLLAAVINLRFQDVARNMENTWIETQMKIPIQCFLKKKVFSPLWDDFDWFTFLSLKLFLEHRFLLPGFQARVKTVPCARRTEPQHPFSQGTHSPISIPLPFPILFLLYPSEDRMRCLCDSTRKKLLYSN